jgi:hypothetical protein
LKRETFVKNGGGGRTREFSSLITHIFEEVEKTQGMLLMKF